MVFAWLWHTGWRVSEVLAPRWSDVEWDTARVHITRHPSGRVAHAAMVREVTALRRQQQLVEAVSADQDSGGQGDGRVFPTDQGQPLSMARAQRLCVRYRQRAAVSARSLNDLRKGGPRGRGRASY